MRLSTEPDRDDDRAVEVLHAALDAGVTLLDTADAYCRDENESGHNERLIRRALSTWRGDRSRVVIATKGGLTRPDGNWVADGRARHLAAACERSRRALGVDRIDLYQLHAPDPRTPLSTSVRALRALQRGGLVEAIGLCNVNVPQIEEASGIAAIASVQVELSVWRPDAILGGVVGYCAAHGITLLAHRPLGGRERRHRTASDPLLLELAARYAATPFNIALAWLRSLSSVIVPIPGATRVETAQSLARVKDLRLSDDDRARLDERFAAGARLRGAPASTIDRPVAPSNGEIVMIMGLPGAGKSTLAHTFVERGFSRLNRDEAGGSLTRLLPALERLADAGDARIVLDNTYVSRKSRALVVQAAEKRGLPVRCIWLSTTVEDAQVNTVFRMVSKYGRLLGPEEMKEATRRDVSAFGPAVQFRYQRELEPPDAAEGFSRIEIVPFTRATDPSFTNRAVIVWLDGVLTRSRTGRRTPLSPDDVEVVSGRGERLRRLARDGWRVAGLSWQPEVAAGDTSPAEVESIFARTRELLDVPIEILHCPHAAGPPVCWCRKPLPGLGVQLIHQHRLDAPACLYVGGGSQDPGFARRLGFQYQDASEFFA